MILRAFLTQKYLPKIGLFRANILNQPGDQGCPASLMTGPQALSGLSVEVFVE
jgi:hypothetical protein